ncbi:hypothetical protein [Rodentibacter heidelbergensis]|uniref:HEAT repeat domain-containing protein n=1 Tax=Rodentibacter heidelbergensis TaxID=1908258 RepID=A0A1V3I751_9PAST|nr:hypothetical protein [Rodentibacter heidelbergensis]OOF35553.1 hypothetical protein BKK48_09655 [Rodentibacter heidelbergensis]
MLKPEEIYDVLYRIPKGVDSTIVLEDLDLKDIPKDRINKIISIIYDHDYYDDFDLIKAASLLSNWGFDEGFYFLSSLLLGEKENKLLYELLIDEEVYKMIFYAIIGYWGSVSDSNIDGSHLKDIMFPVVSKLIELASINGFNISYIYFMILDYDFVEFVPLVKKYLSNIIDDSSQYWNIHDSIKLLMKIEPGFAIDLIHKKNKELSDFGIEI